MILKSSRIKLVGSFTYAIKGDSNSESPVATEKNFDTVRELPDSFYFHFVIFSVLSQCFLFASFHSFLFVLFRFFSWCFFCSFHLVSRSVGFILLNFPFVFFLYSLFPFFVTYLFMPPA